MVKTSITRRLTPPPPVPLSIMQPPGEHIMLSYVNAHAQPKPSKLGPSLSGIAQALRSTMHIPQEAPKSREPPRPKSQTGTVSGGAGGAGGKPPRQRSVTPPPSGGITGGALNASPARIAGGGGVRGSSPSRQAADAGPSELPSVPPRAAVVAASKGEARLCLVAILSGQQAAISTRVSHESCRA